FNDDLDLDSDSDVDDDDNIIARIQYFPGENDDILRAKDRKQRNRVFRAIHNGKFEFTETAAAADPFALTKKGGNKAREAARQAVASVGLEMVVGHQRRFVEDLRSAPTLSLLPMSRLKNTNEGNGAARFTKLVKTMLSGLRADERNIDWSNVGLQVLSAM
ncbi:hypothetical protein EDB86DRAFT_2918457, partial [Lactarius hatsudake]